jgi:preprotein translocase subunit SecG
MFFTFLLVVQFIVAALMVGVILMQKSEGGGLTSGGSPSGLMSARGAADFLTRATAILAAAFIILSITLAVLAASRHSTRIDSSLQKAAPAATTPLIPAPGAAAGNTSAAFPKAGAPMNTTAPANSTVPFGQ